MRQSKPACWPQMTWEWKTQNDRWHHLPVITVIPCFIFFFSSLQNEYHVVFSLTWRLLFYRAGPLFVTKRSRPLVAIIKNAGLKGFYICFRELGSLKKPLHSHILRAPSLCFTVGTIRSDIIHEPSLTQICTHQIKLRTSTGLDVHLPSTSISRDFFIKPDSRSLLWTDEMRLWFDLCEGLMLAPSWAAVNWWFLKL